MGQSGNILCLGLLVLLQSAIYGYDMASLRNINKKEIMLSSTQLQITDIGRLPRNHALPIWKVHSGKGVRSDRVDLRVPEAEAHQTEQQAEGGNEGRPEAVAALNDALSKNYWQDSMDSMVNENPNSSVVFINNQRRQTRINPVHSILQTTERARVRNIRTKKNSGNLTLNFFAKQPTAKSVPINNVFRWTALRKQKRHFKSFSSNWRPKRSSQKSNTGLEEAGRPIKEPVKTHRCSTDSIALHLALQAGRQWAQRMSDSSAHLWAGTIDYMGLDGECLSVSVPESRGFQPHYCVLTFTSDQTPHQYPPTRSKPRPPTGHHAGLCVPDTCTHDDVIAIFHQDARHAGLKDLDVQRLFCTSQDSVNMTAGAAGVLTFLGLWALLVLVASACHVLCGRAVSFSLPRQQRPAPPTRRVRYRLKREEETGNLLSADESTDSGTVEIDIDSDSDSQSSRLQQPQRPDYGAVSRNISSQQTKLLSGIVRMELNISLVHSAQIFRNAELNNLKQLLKCFSLELNLQKLVDTTKTQTEIACLHGIRVLSLAWVVLLNCVMCQLTYARNAVQVLEAWREHSLMYSFIGNGNLALDSLFTVSGLLLGYVYSHEIHAQMDNVNWIIHIVIRYTRIIPSMAIIGVIYLTLLPVVVDGPLLMNAAPDMDVCTKQWWMNALLVQNFASPACMSWTWFLAVDFQLFLFTPVLIRLLYHRPRLAYILVLLLVSASWVVCGALTLVHHLPVTPFVFPDPGNVSDSAVEQEAFNSYYLHKPWTHAASFFPPLLVGFLLHTCNRRASFRTRTVAAGWTGALVGAVIVLCAMNEDMVKAADRPDDDDVGTRVVYNASRSTVWSLCLCWVVLACSTGYGGPVNSLLAWPGWKPLSRLVFLTYLVHPVVMLANAACLHQSLYLTPAVAAFHYLGILVCSFLLSFFLALFWEMPLNALLSWAGSCCASGSRRPQ